jgi:26S proteasome regulatory subunit N2
MTRVLPAQASLLSFPSSGRYQPIRPVSEPSSTRSNEEKKTLGGMPRPTVTTARETIRAGSILLLRDTKEGEDGDYVDLDRALWPPVEVKKVVVEEVEATMPQPFQYPFDEEH